MFARDAAGGYRTMSVGGETTKASSRAYCGVFSDTTPSFRLSSIDVPLRLFALGNLMSFSLGDGRPCMEPFNITRMSVYLP